MRELTQRLFTLVTAGAVFLVSGSAGALAHECMVVNRSEQGQRAVGASPMWLSENMATPEAYQFVFDVLGVTPTQVMLDDAVALHIKQGLQEWTAFFNHHTLLADPKTDEDTPAGARHSADLKGVDHWSDTELGQAMIRIADSLS